jgi:MFS family permease
MVRVFGWDLADAGRTYGLIALLSGSGGVLMGPSIARLLERRGHSDATLLVAIVAAASAATCLVALPLQGSATGALVCIAGAGFSVTVPLALVTSTMQLVTPNEMRGVVNGAYVVTSNVMGLALGPTLVALCTDYVFEDPNAVARSLALVSMVVGPIAIALLYSGRNALRAASR